MCRTGTLCRALIHRCIPGGPQRCGSRGLDVGFFGELHPHVADAFDMEGRRVQVAEIDLDSVFEHASDAPAYRPLHGIPRSIATSR